MSFRITTTGLFRNYSTNLHASQVRLNDSMTRVETGRAFNSYAEDPAAASMAFQLRRNFWRTGDQIDNSNYLISKFSTAFDALDPIIDSNGEGQDLSGIKDTLFALNGTAGNSRAILGEEILTVANSVMHTFNGRYGDEYLFAGADGLRVPFTMTAGGSEAPVVMYRGVSVDAPKPYTEAEFNTAKEAGFQDQPQYKEWLGDQEATFENYKTWLKKTFDQSNTERTAEKFYNDALKRYDEATYVDIGLGFSVDDKGVVEPSSAYNSALSGLDFLGYGLDKDGDPKNLVSLMNQLGSIFKSCDKDTGEYASKADEEKAERLVQKLNGAIDNLQKAHVYLSAETGYLRANLEQLEGTKLTINEQIENTEQMDPAKAIQEMMWAQYSYNAALRIGNQVLTQSLLDYLG